MDVTFANKSVFTLCTKDKKRAKKLGHQSSHELKIALDELQAATCLAEIKALPYRRLHPLKGDQAGAYSIDIDDQYRIWFEIPDVDELLEESGVLNYEKVTVVQIYRVGDPHD